MTTIFFAFLGYRGSGKTWLTQKLLLHYRFLVNNKRLIAIGMDDELPNRLGRSIADEVKQRGWKHFRAAETMLLKEILLNPHFFFLQSVKNNLDAKNMPLREMEPNLAPFDEMVLDKNLRICIIDCGGGVAVAQENRDLLGQYANTVFLDTPLELLVLRQLKKPRPALKNISKEESVSQENDSIEPKAMVEKTIRKETEAVLDERLPLYNQAADFKVNVKHIPETGYLETKSTKLLEQVDFFQEVIQYIERETMAKLQ